MFKKHNFMDKKIKIAWGIVILVVISCSIYYFFFSNQMNSGVSGPTINVSYDNLAEVLSRNSMVRSLPKDSEVLLKFYNFDSGEREIEKSFLFGEKIIETSQDSAEVMIFIRSKYLSGLTNKNLCSTFKRANQAGDLSIESSLSFARMTWKYKSMMKYKDCF
jgi:hypothetical protein